MQAWIVGGLLADELSSGPWTRNGLATERFTITGTGGRNNPLRKPLDPAFAGDEIFIRFNLRYAAKSLDSPPATSGEFFVLWLDELEGNDGSGHAANIPNVGIHVQGNQNRFMARYNSSNQKFGEVLQGDRDYLILGRLWKSTSGHDQPFDQLSLWVDPQGDEELTPDVSLQSGKSISKVNWIGFSTGAKTEIDDRIDVWEVRTADSWNTILDLPDEPTDPNYAPEMLRPPSKKTISFREHIQPLLKKHCFECHAGKDAEEGVRLDVVDEVLQQISPLQHQKSHLYQLVATGKMPPEAPSLPPQELQLIARWIDEGLDWDTDSLPHPVPVSDHWAFHPIERPTIPVVKHAAWVVNPIDAFIAAQHENVGLVANPMADRQTLNRRLSLGLHGIPPRTEDMGELLKIDGLLSNPAYGQRWARYWLDIARWAESNGHQHNRDRLHAWRYRDWVIDAFNQGIPFDRFLREQIAGDEISPSSPQNMIATGFLAAARYSGNELDKRIQRNDILIDITNTTASAFLGLTLECAQCHSHKFDPLSIRDYYRFQGFFISGQPQNLVLGKSESAHELAQERWILFNQVQQRLVRVRRKQGYPEPILITPENVVAQMRPDERTAFGRLESQLAKLDQTWGFYSPSSASAEPVVAPHKMRWQLPHDPEVLGKLKAAILIRGDLQARGPEVTSGWPRIFGEVDEASKTRLQLAHWLTHPEHPLTARVWVNRLWQWHFGRGLVETSSDFGTQGTSPSHPKLLDFLASELIDHAWNTRHIQRMILESATYRMSSEYSAANAKLDPDNRLLWRWKPRRLESEAIRDSVLAVSGQLDHSSGGPSALHDSYRRSIYLKQKRDNLPSQQVLFDSANGIISCARRRVSTSPLQPLWLMNSDLIQIAAKQFAERAGSVESAIQIAFHRQATELELQQLQELADQFGLASACLAIMNSSEFLYIP